MHVGERRGDHPGSEGRRIQLVVGVEDQRDVERLHRLGAGHRARHQIEEVGCEVQAAAGRERFLRVPQAVEERHHRR